MKIIFLNPVQLKPHEQISFFKLVFVFMKIIIDGKFTKPILVDENTNTILDGHHRVAVAKLLKLRKIPAVAIDYLAENNIFVEPRRSNILITKDIVIASALSKKLFPHKTTNHVFINYDFPFISIPLVGLYNSETTL